MNTEQSEEQTKTKEENGSENTGKSLKDTIDSLGKALGIALENRANVVMVRVNDQSLEKLDMLIEAEITKSRSESAAFLIKEGSQANQELFREIKEITDKIEGLRAELREKVQLNPEEKEEVN